MDNEVAVGDGRETNAEDKFKGEKSSHCHCHLFHVNDELLALMNHGQPYQRYKGDIKKRDRRIWTRR